MRYFPPETVRFRKIEASFLEENIVSWTEINLISILMCRNEDIKDF